MLKKLKKIGKKGFTLIELLASIAILAVVLLLVTISYSKIRKNTLEKQYKNLKTLIEQVAIRYSSKTGAYNFFVDELIKEGYLEPDDDNKIYDPRDKETLNCHLISISDEDPMKATLHEENHANNDGTCDPSSISGYSSSLLLNAKLSGTDTVYASDITVNSTSVYPLIYNGWTKYNLDITPDITRISEDKEGSKMVWNNNPDVVTYYPNLTHTTSESVIYDDFYYADYYLSNDARYQARLKYKMDNEKPVIYHEKTALAKSTDNDEWVKSRIVIMYVTDKDGVGLDRVYIGPRPCSDLLTDATMGQAAIPGLVQAYNLNGEIPETGINANVCAVDKLGNLADGGNINVKKIDSVAPRVTTDVYVFDDVKYTDLTQYTGSPLLTVTGNTVDIIDAHPSTDGWTNTGHMYKFSVVDEGAGLYDGNRALWSYSSYTGTYAERTTLDMITVLGLSPLSTNNVNVFGAGISGKGRRIGRFSVCDKLNNCGDVNIIHDRIDKDGPTITSMNFVYSNWSAYNSNTWTNADVFAARTQDNKVPIATDPGCGVVDYNGYQIRDAENDSNQFVNYAYTTSSSLYKMSDSKVHVREFRAKDILGNYGPGYTVQGLVDKQAPDVKAYIGAMLYKDPNFNSGTNNITVYNNKNNGVATLTRQTGSTPEGSHYLHFKSTGETSPDRGGFYFAHPTAANKTYLTRIVAKIPVGYTLNWTSNTIGSKTTDWLTPHEGTGQWEDYLHILNVGDTTTLGTAGHFYLSGGSQPTESNPLEWDIAYATVFDTTKYDSQLYVISRAWDNANGSRVGFVNVTKNATSNYPTNAEYSEKRRIRVRADGIIENGTYNAFYKDVAGNEGHASASTTYVDRTKPAITVKAYNYCGSCTNKAGTTKYNEQTFTDDGTLYINSSKWLTQGVSFVFTVTDAQGGLSKVSWRWDTEYNGSAWATTSNGGSEGNVTVQSTSSFTFDENLTGSGQRRAIINATDNNGNKTTVVLYAKVDMVAPTCGSISGQSTTYTNQNRYITVGCSDDTGGSGCVSNPVGNDFGAEREQGTIRIYDNAGNYRDCTVNVYIDKTPPTVYIDDYKYDASATNNVGTALWLHNSSGTNTYSGISQYHNYNAISGVDNLPYCITFKVSAADSKSGLNNNIEWWRDIQYYQDRWPDKFKDVPDTGTLVYYNNFNVKGYREALLIVKDNAGNETKVTIRAKVRAGYSGGNCSGGSAPSGGGSGGSGGSSGSGGTGACPGYQNTCKPKNSTLLTPMVASGRNLDGSCMCPHGYTDVKNVGRNPKFGCKKSEEQTILTGIDTDFRNAYRNGTSCAFNGTSYSLTNKPSIWFTDEFSGLSYYKIYCSSTSIRSCTGTNQNYASNCRTDNSGDYGYRFVEGVMKKCQLRNGSEYVAYKGSNTENVSVCCE